MRARSMKKQVTNKNDVEAPKKFLLRWTNVSDIDKELDNIFEKISRILQDGTITFFHAAQNTK